MKFIDLNVGDTLVSPEGILLFVKTKPEICEWSSNIYFIICIQPDLSETMWFALLDSDVEINNE